MKQIFSIPLCSQCLVHEVTSWLTEKAGVLSQPIIRDIYLELRDIKLEQGKCIVCKNEKISSDCFNRLLKILEKNDTPKQIVKEFSKMFGFRD